MNIVIEGTDGCFKTTVAQKLSEKLGYPVFKGSSFEHATGTNENLYKFSLDVIDTNSNQLVDRSIYSNLVYSHLYPGYARLTDKQVKKIEGKLKQTDSIVIYLTASPNIIVKRIEERGDDHVTTDRIGDIVNEYNHVISEAVDRGVKVYTFDTGVLSSDKIVEQIIEFLSLKKEKEESTCVCCGSPDAEYLSNTHCFVDYMSVMEDIFRSHITNE